MGKNSARSADFRACKSSPRTLARSSIALSAAILLASISPAPAAARGRVTHVMIFWLKQQENRADRAALRHASESFRTMPGILNVEVGHSLPVRRAGIEQAFDLSVVFTFANRAALERFSKDPQHAAAVRTVLKPLVKRFVVFDSVAN